MVLRLPPFRRDAPCRCSDFIPKANTTYPRVVFEALKKAGPGATVLEGNDGAFLIQGAPNSKLEPFIITKTGKRARLDGTPLPNAQ